MNVVVPRTLTIVLALVIITGVHGAELCAAARIPAPTDDHDCGCFSSCVCRGPVKGCRSSKGATLKSLCGCGCGAAIHVELGSSAKGLCEGCFSMVAPSPCWTAVSIMTGTNGWRLAQEHDHPPRSFSGPRLSI